MSAEWTSQLEKKRPKVKKLRGFRLAAQRLRVILIVGWVHNAVRLESIMGWVNEIWNILLGIIEWVLLAAEG
ncbi:MAG: hypothetical protein LC135_04290 [Phycisphaerae bacterium]|nr:hypothetical protein [Phycisphaerae bacterium]MCZ2399072.1 hypothetical protein [Phycisphaerae bacterium]NUQ50122.1 hypothetical protein [Phycisphaerae bacterium]